jgi:hypothetical protein
MKHLYLNQHLHPHQHPLVIPGGPVVIGLRGLAWQWRNRVWPFLKRLAEPSNYPKARAGGRLFPCDEGGRSPVEVIITPVDNLGITS